MSVQAQELSHCGQHTITHMWKTKQLLSDDASFDRSCLFGVAPLRFAVLFWRKWILEVSVELVAQNFDTLWSKMCTENICLTSHTVTLSLLVLLPKDRKKYVDRVCVTCEKLTDDLQNTRTSDMKVNIFPNCKPEMSCFLLTQMRKGK